MKKLIQFLIFAILTGSATAAPNDILLTQANATTGSSWINTVVPGTPNIQIGTNSSSKTAIVGVIVPTMAALRSMPVSNLTDKLVLTLSGYYTPGDGGGGLFIYNAGSSAVDNGGTVIKPSVGPGRWIRSFTGAINVLFFGTKGDGSTDDTLAIQGAINALQSYRGSVYIPRAAYKITTSLTLSAGGGAGNPTIIYGDGQATQIINACGSNTPTFSFAGVSYWVLRDLLLSGNSTNKNDGVLVCKDGSGNQSARFLIENVVACMAGRGFVLQNTNTGTIRACKIWPSSNSGSFTVTPVVSGGDISHGVYLTGTFCNDISIYDLDCQPQSGYAAGMASIKCDAASADDIGIYRGNLEGGTSGSGVYAIYLANAQFGTIDVPYCENSDITLSNCRYLNLRSIDQSSGGALLITGSSVFNQVQDCESNTLQFDSGSNQNNVIGGNFYSSGTPIADSGTNNTYLGVATTGVGSAQANSVFGHWIMEGVTSTGATGTLKFVFSNSPTFTGSPALSTATAASLNGLIITPTSGTLTIPNSASAALILSGNFGTTLTATATTNSTLPSGTHSLAPLDSPALLTPTATGVTSGTGAASGIVGETFDFSLARASRIGLTTGTQTNVVTFTVPAGDWEVTYGAGYLPASTTVMADAASGISSSSATLPSLDTNSRSAIALQSSSNGDDIMLSGGSVQINVSTNTTYYLVSYSDFTVSTMQVYGHVHGRRIR